MSCHFEWKGRSGVKGLSASDAGNELAKLDREGKASNEEIVAAAMPDDSVLHCAFDWDDAIAGHRWRLKQVGELRRSIEVVYKKPGGEEARAPAFVSVVMADDGDEDKARQRYMLTTDALANDESRKLVLAQCKRDIIAWRRRFACLRDVVEVAGIIGAIDDAFPPVLDEAAD